MRQTSIYIGKTVAIATLISAMISEEFLRLLRCPASLKPLAVADESLVALLNKRVAAGQLVNQRGDVVSQSLDGGLVDEPATLVYPVRSDIPCLLVDEAIPLSQLEAVGE